MLILLMICLCCHWVRKYAHYKVKLLTFNLTL